MGAPDASFLDPRDSPGGPKLLPFVKFRFCFIRLNKDRFLIQFATKLVRSLMNSVKIRIAYDRYDGIFLIMFAIILPTAICLLDRVPSEMADKDVLHKLPCRLRRTYRLIGVLIVRADVHDVLNVGLLRRPYEGYY